MGLVSAKVGGVPFHIMNRGDHWHPFLRSKYSREGVEKAGCHDGSMLTKVQYMMVGDFMWDRRCAM